MISKNTQISLIENSDVITQSDIDAANLVDKNTGLDIGIPSGANSRVSFGTQLVTLPELANIVATLIRDLQGLSLINAPIVPSCTVNPLITGVAATDQTLTGTAGTYVGTPTIVITHQWQQYSSGIWTNISGATSIDYVVQATDVGKTLRRVETATNTADSITTYTAASDIASTSYYVTKAGNDTTGNGLTSGTAWLTVEKALDTVPIAGNAIIWVGDGTYAVNVRTSKYAYLDRNFSDWVTVRAINPGAVTVTDAASASFLLRYLSATKVGWHSITLVQAGTNSQSAVYLASGANARFINCTIQTRNWGIFTNATGAVSFEIEGCLIEKRSDAGALNIVPVYCVPGTGGTVTATLRNSEFIGQSPLSFAAAVLFQTGGGTFTATMENCNVTGTSSYGTFAIGGRLDVTGGVYQSDTSPALVLGGDGDNLGTLTYGSVLNSQIASNTSHSLLVGQGTIDVNVTGVTVTDGDHGIVVKGVNSVIDDCDISGVSMYGIYLKGCTNPIVRNSRITASGNGYAAIGITTQVNGSTSIKVTSPTITDNEITATGAADCLYLPSAHLAGTAVADRNIYDYSASSGDVGTVLAATNITTKAGLIAAWSGYGDGTNDANSTVTV